MKSNEGRCVGVKIGPDLAEMIGQAVIEQSGFLDLGLVIALQNDSYEQL